MDIRGLIEETGDVTQAVGEVVGRDADCGVQGIGCGHRREDRFARNRYVCAGQFR